MRQLTLEELECAWADVEDAVDATPGIDPWCSGPDWQIPVTRAYAPRARRLVLATETGPTGTPANGPTGRTGNPANGPTRPTGGPAGAMVGGPAGGPAAGHRGPAGYALLAHYRLPDIGPAIGGMEPLWGFGSPLLGADPGALATELADDLGRRRGWRALFLPGLPPLAGGDDQGGHPGHPGGAGHDTTLAVAVGLSSLGQVSVGEGITRRIIDLDGGYEAWLDRRSPRFRRNLRKAEQAATDAGLAIEELTAADPDELFTRMLAVEHRSWKGRQGSGLAGPDMESFYRMMVDRLRPRGRLLAHVAVLGGTDVGYILGGVRNRRYRGLQLSYVAEAGDLSIGNLLQAHQLRQLTGDDLADVYDLGMDFDYKRRWADRAEASVTLVVQR